MKTIQRAPSKLLLTLIGSAALAVVSGAAFGGISTTKHNLTAAGPGPNKVTTGTDEICVFCHTPHGASSAVGGPPLWNKVLPAATTYTLYSSSTIDGNVNTTNAPSLACLSCHDGTQAMDNIINAPGSGGFDTTGGGVNGLGFTWASGGTADSNGKLTSGIALIGTDLSNDHPVMIEYCGGGKTGAGAVVSGTCRDVDFVGQDPATTTRLQTKSVTVGAGAVQVFWVETGVVDNTATRTDLRLYTRPGGNTPFVECASCHDPHVSQGQAGPNGQNAGATFLRVSNTGSAVCLSCHVK
jgi:Doubled CXXCH motif (Paired_CXXCH_1)